MGKIKVAAAVATTDELIDALVEAAEMRGQDLAEAVAAGHSSGIDVLHAVDLARRNLRQHIDRHIETLVKERDQARATVDRIRRVNEATIATIFTEKAEHKGAFDMRTRAHELLVKLGHPKLARALLALSYVMTTCKACGERFEYGKRCLGCPGASREQQRCCACGTGVDRCDIPCPECGNATFEAQL